jgi:hypothetical protein
MKAKLHLTPDSSNTTVPFMENSFKPLPSEDTFYPMVKINKKIKVLSPNLLELDESK